MTNAVAAMLREEGETLLSWCQAWITLQMLAARLGVVYPNSHWYKQCMGQVSLSEITSGQFAVAKTRQERDTFQITEFETQVLAKSEGSIAKFPSRTCATTRGVSSSTTPSSGTS